MKTDLAVLEPFLFPIRALLLSVCLFLGASVGAQNLVKNPGFELPIGTNDYGNFRGGANFPLGTTTGGEAYNPSWKATWNWMIAYPWGGPSDWELRDRCTKMRGGAANYWGACFRPAHDKWAHAYYTQTITNLEVGHLHSVSGWMAEDRWKAVDDALRDEMLVYIEAIGGQGTPTGDGRFAVRAVCTTTNNLDGPPFTYPNNDWLQFTNKQTPAPDGTIEIRLHHHKLGWVHFDKLERMAGYFDDISLTR